MNFEFNTFYNYSVNFFESSFSLINNELPRNLTVQEKKIVSIALIAIGCFVALYLLIGCCFRKKQLHEQNPIKQDKILEESPIPENYRLTAEEKHYENEMKRLERGLKQRTDPGRFYITILPKNQYELENKKEKLETKLKNIDETLKYLLNQKVCDQRNSIIKIQTDAQKEIEKEINNLNTLLRPLLRHLPMADQNEINNYQERLNQFTNDELRILVALYFNRSIPVEEPLLSQYEEFKKKINLDFVFLNLDKLLETPSGQAILEHQDSWKAFLTERFSFIAETLRRRELPKEREKTIIKTRIVSSGHLGRVKTEETYEEKVIEKEASHLEEPRYEPKPYKAPAVVIPFSSIPGKSIPGKFDLNEILQGIRLTPIEEVTKKNEKTTQQQNELPISRVTLLSLIMNANGSESQATKQTILCRNQADAESSVSEKEFSDSD